MPTHIVPTIAACDHDLLSSGRPGPPLHLAACPLNGDRPVALTLPALDVAVHLVVSALLLLGVLA